MSWLAHSSVHNLAKGILVTIAVFHNYLCNKQIGTDRAPHYKFINQFAVSLRKNELYDNKLPPDDGGFNILTLC